MKEKNIQDLIINCLPGIFYLFDSKWKMVRWNKNLENLSEYSDKEISKMLLLDFFDEEDKNIFSEKIKEVLSSGKSVLEASLLSKSGKKTPLFFHAFRAKIDNKSYIIGTGTDISEQRRIRVKMRGLSRAVEQSPVIVVITDTKGRIEYVNPKFIEVTGYTREEVLGKNLRILKSGEQPVEFYKKLWDTITSGNVWTGIFHNKKKNGEYYWENASISPIRNNKGRITRFVAVKEDVTEKKKTMEALQNAHIFNTILLNTIPFGMDIVDDKGTVLFLNSNWQALVGKDALGKKCWELYKDNKKRCDNCPLFAEIKTGKTSSIEVEGCLGGRILQITHTGMIYEGKNAILEIFQDITERRNIEEKLRNALEIKSKFTSMVSHELRTPLTSIKEGISIVLDGSAGEINVEQKEFLNLAKRNTDRLHRLINDVLDFTKLENGKVEFKIETNSLKAAITEVVEAQLPVAKHKGIFINTEIAESPEEINFDYDRILQVLNNLIDNAIKFTMQGGITVKCNRDDESSTVTVRIKDTGEGIREEDIPEIFIKFRQVGKTKYREPGSTGLGMAICKEIIDTHHGRIWVESKYGIGSEFIFTLPYNKK